MEYLLRIKNPNLNITCNVNHRIKNMVVRVTHAITRNEKFRGVIIYDARTTSAYSGIVDCSNISLGDLDYSKILDYVNRIGPVPGTSDGHYDDPGFALWVIPYMGTDAAVLFNVDLDGNVTHVPLVITVDS